MANEFKHLSVGASITQGEFEAVGGHVLDSQATGDIIYATSASQLSRLGIGSTGAVLVVDSGVPTWDTSPTIAGLLTADSLTVTGTTTLNGNLVLGDAATDTLAITSTITGGTPLVFEGATADGYETSFVITDPTADRTITFADSSITVNAAADISGTTLASNVVTTSATTVGALNSGSITSGFTSIDVGSGAITTTGALSIASMGTNWTNAGRTVADAGILTTVDINGGTIDGAIIGGASAVAITGTAVTGTSIVGGTVAGTTGTFTGVLDVTDVTDATDATGDTGALRTEGGASIAKKLYVGSDLNVTGDLTVSGTTTTVTSSTVAIADSLLLLAKDQGTSTDAVDFGLYGKYGVGGTAKYAGIFRDGSVTGDPWTFFDTLEAEPGTEVNTAGTGYDLADISAGAITSADGFSGDLTGNVTGNTSGTAATVTGGTQAAITTVANVVTVGTITTGVWNGTAIASAYIAADAVTGAKIADNAIDSEHYTDGSIDNAHIADNAIDSEHYAAGSIDNEHLADDAVDSAELADGAVDTAHIADDQVTLDKMAGLARGSIIIGNATGDPTALAVGSNTYVLRSDGTDIAWSVSSDSDTTYTAGDGLDLSGTTFSTDLMANGGLEITGSELSVAKGIAVNDVAQFAASVADDDFLRIAGTAVEGLSAAEVAAAIQGSITAVGTIASGVWNGTAVANANLANSAVTITAGAGMTGGGSTALGAASTLNVIAGSGMTVNADDIAITAAQTAITSLYNASLKVGRDTHNQFDFATDNAIKVSVNAVDDEFRFVAGGNFHADADVFAYSSTTASDRNIKKNIVEISDALSKVKALHGVTFDYKEEHRGSSVGLIAQDVQALYPELVTQAPKLHGTDDETYLSLNYNGGIGLLVEAVKELAEEVRA